MKIKRRRVGNIEVRPTKFESEPYEIICWQRNAQYYDKDQYELVPGSTTSYRRKDGTGHCTWDVSCFQNPESCYVVAIVMDCKNEEPDIRSIGKRPWDLSEADRADFDEIIRAIYNDYYASYGNEME